MRDESAELPNSATHVFALNMTDRQRWVFTPAEIARVCGVSDGEVDGWIETGLLATCSGPSLPYRISADALRVFLSRYEL